MSPRPRADRPAPVPAPLQALGRELQTVAPAESDAATPIALVVDGDAVSRRFVELALAHEHSFVVESATDAMTAVEILKVHSVDLIVSESDLPDMNGLRFFRQLGQEQRLRDISFVFLSSDRRADSKIAAFRAGADDYLTKPCDVAEFRARAEALVARRRRLRDAQRRRNYLLSGDFAALHFADIVSIISIGQRSGLLSVATGRSTGQVFFSSGMAVHAVYGNLVGVKAFQSMVGEVDGHFEFSPGACELAPESYTIDGSPAGLLLDAARLSDEEAHSRKLGPAATVSPPRPASVSAPRSHTVPPRLSSALAPDATLAAQFELGLRDPFALGEMRLWTEDDLARWTRAEGGSARLHIVFIADLAAGVSALLALAGSPTERWVLGGLSATKKAFGLTFFLRQERTVDIVLLDAHAPSAFQASLGRTPSVMIIAPPDGDLMTLGISSRVALEAIVQQLDPPAVVGVGNAALMDGLVKLRIGEDRLLRCTQSALGESADARSLLIKAVRLWAASAGKRPTFRPTQG